MMMMDEEKEEAHRNRGVCNDAITDLLSHVVLK